MTTDPTKPFSFSYSTSTARVGEAKLDETEEVPKAYPADQIAEELRQTLTGWAGAFAGDVLDKLPKLYEREVGGEDARGSAEALKQEVRSARSRWESEHSDQKISTGMRAAMVATAAFQAVQLQNFIKAAIGVEPLFKDTEVDRYINFATRDGAQRFKGIIGLAADQMEGVIDESLEIGRRPDIFAKRIAKRLSTAESYATAQAKNDVSTLYGEVNKLRQEELGIDGYVWRSSEDVRVRPTHKRNNGRKFSWSDPPDDTGHPGDDYGCRCHADPDLSGITGGDIAAPKEGPLTDTPEGKPELVEKYKPKPKPPTASPSPRQDPASGRMRGVKYFNPDWDEEKKARWFLWQWVNGSKSKGSVLGKKAAIEEFGLAGKPFSKTDWNHSPKNLEALRPGLRKVYEQTQEDLFSEPHLEELRKMGKLTHVKTIGGKKHIKLYRGVKEKYDEAERGSLESWTINRGTADAFAGKNGDVEVQWVDAERILAHHKGPQWKNGKYGEQYEYVVMW